jgi:hypothetical protein
MQPHEPGDQRSSPRPRRDLASFHRALVFRMFVRPSTTHKEFGNDQAQGSEFHVCLGRPQDS